MATIGSRGYTFIELLVVAGLVGILSVGLVAIFLGSLRGSSNAQVEAEVKSQGDYAITVMERSLRQAAGAPQCSVDRVTYQVLVDQTPVDKSFVVSGNQINIDDVASNGLFGNTGLILNNAVFTCMPPSAGGSGSGSVTISFSLSATGKMNQTVTQVFKTTVAIRSVQ